MKKQIKKIEILIESPYTGEVETIDAGTEANALIISTHLAEHILQVTSTDGHVMSFSGMNQWGHLHSVFNGTASKDAAAFARTHN